MECEEVGCEEVKCEEVGCEEVGCEEVECEGRVGRAGCEGDNHHLVCVEMGGCDEWTLCFVWSWGGVIVRMGVGRE